MKRSDFLAPRKEVEPETEMDISNEKQEFSKMPATTYEEQYPIQDESPPEQAPAEYGNYNPRIYADIPQAAAGAVVDMGDNPVGLRIMAGGHMYSIMSVSLNLDQYGRRSMQISLVG
jgi:hypothetical protein